MPSGTLVYSITNTTVTQVGATFTVNLVPAVHAAPGTYFSESSQHDLSPNGEWGWTDRTAPCGAVLPLGKTRAAASGMCPPGRQAGDVRYWCKRTRPGLPAERNNYGQSPAYAPRLPRPRRLVPHILRVLHDGRHNTAGTTDIGNNCDDCVTAITFPPVSIYGTTYTGANVSSNGSLDLTGVQAPFTHGCQVFRIRFGAMPFYRIRMTCADNGPYAGCAGFPGGNCGIFTRTSARTYIEWRAVHFADTTTSANFGKSYCTGATQIHFDIIYGATSDSGLDGTSGWQAGSTGPATTFSCGTATLTSGLKVTYTLPPCAPALLSAVSRKTCGTTNFDIPLPLTCPSGWNAASRGSGYLVVAAADQAVSTSPLPVASVVCVSWRHRHHRRRDGR